MNKKIIGYGILGGIIFVLLILSFAGIIAPITTSSGFGTWIAAFLTLSIFSFLYKDNPFYKFAEHMFIGVSAAYWMVYGIWQTLIPNLIGRLSPGFVAKHFDIKSSAESNLFYIVPLILGILLLCKLYSKISWVSRWALAFIIGTTAGLNFVKFLMSNFIAQIRSSIIPLVVVKNGSFMIGQSFSNTILISGLIASIFYFFFSKEHKGWFGKVSRYGIVILMVTFGAAFGYTVMGRIALLIGRLEFLLRDWLLII